MRNLGGRSAVVQRVSPRVFSASLHSVPTVTELLPNAGYEAPGCNSFANIYTYQFNDSLGGSGVPATFHALSNVTLSHANSPANVPGAGTPDALDIHITNTASPAVFGIFDTGTNGQPVEPCSRYRYNFFSWYGDPSEGTATRWTYYVDQYDASGAQISGGNGLDTGGETGNSGWAYNGHHMLFDTEPNAAFVRLRVAITGRTSVNDVWSSGFLFVQLTCNSRVWRYAVPDGSAATDLLADYADDVEDNTSMPLPTTAPTNEGCTGLPFSGSYAGQGTVSTDGTGYEYLAFGPIVAFANGNYVASYVFAGAYDTVNARTAMLWYDASWAALSVEVNSQNGLDNNNGCWFGPVTHTFAAPSLAAHALLLIAVANPGNFTTAADFDATSVKV